MKWFDVLQHVQNSGDKRQLAMLIAAMWSALADGPEWVLVNALMNFQPPFYLAASLDGAQLGVTAEARMMLSRRKEHE